MRRHPLAAVSLVVSLLACGDAGPDHGAPTAGSAPSPPAAGSTSPSSSAPSVGSSRAPTPVPGESTDVQPPAEHASDALVGGSAADGVVRAVVDDGLLRDNPEIVAAHFGDDPPFPLQVQRVALHGGRQAALFAATRGGVVPLIVVADEAGRPLFAKRRPLAGTREQVRGLRLVAGPGGSLAIAWWDEPTRAVALRRWDYDGSAFADHHLFDADGCDGLDATYWPGHGWIVTVTTLREGAARAHLVTEEGLAGFGGAVMEVTSSERLTSPAVAAAGMDGIFHAYLARPAGTPAEQAAPSLWVMLHHADGSSAWRSPVLVARGRTGAEPSTSPRVKLVTPTLLRVESFGEVHDVRSNGRLEPPGGRPAHAGAPQSGAPHE